MFERTLNELRADFHAHKEEVADVFDQLFGKFDNVKDNHIAHLQMGINSLDNRFGKIETDVDWLKRAFWAVFGSSIGALIVGMVNLLVK